MKKKNTDGLLQELMDSPDLTQFLSQNQEQFVNKNVAELLNHLFEKKNIFFRCTALLFKYLYSISTSLYEMQSKPSVERVV